MPASHRAHLEWTPDKLIAWGQRIGVSTAAVVAWLRQTMARSMPPKRANEARRWLSARVPG
jgi:hypothetical protein